MEKVKLTRFIDKYHLGGNVNAVVINSKSNKLSTRFITGDKALLGELTVNNFTFEDTPSTTTAITYKCYVKEDAAGTDMVINRSYSNPGDGYNAPCGTTIQLMEIAQ